MADLPRFKLLFLPYLAYKAILQKMNVREQYKFATLSKRMQSGVRVSNRIAVVSCHIHITKERMRFVVTHENTKSRYGLRFELQERDEFISIAKEQILFLKNSLRLQTVDLVFSNNPLKIELDLVPFLKQEKLKICELICFSFDEGFNDESYEYLLNEVKDCRKLVLSMDCSPNFRPSHCPVLSVDKFVSSTSGWVTADQLITNFMNCMKIYLSGCQFTPHQLNPFIKKWIEGSRIENFHFELTATSQFESIVIGIDSTEIRQAYTPYGHYLFKPNECFLIEQSSGVKALLYERMRRVYLNTNFSLDSPLAERPDDTAAYSFDDDEVNTE